MHWTAVPDTSLAQEPIIEHNVVVSIFTMDPNREFVYERYARKISSCEDTKELQELTCKFLRLYLTQQEVVENLIRKGWLPDNSVLR